MADVIRERIETSEEHLADEIKELETPFLKSWRTWAMTLAAFAALVLVVSAFIIWEAGSIARMAQRRLALTPPASITLQAINEGLESEPRAFRWAPVAGATNYVFIIREAGTDGDVIVIRSLDVPRLTTTDVESATLTNGAFVWSVEARRSDGSRAGYGEGTFAIE